MRISIISNYTFASSLPDDKLAIHQTINNVDYYSNYVVMHSAKWRESLRKAGLKRRVGEYRNCLTCGKSCYFTPHQSIGGKYHGKYCSLSCRMKGNKIRLLDSQKDIDRSFMKDLPQRFKPGHIPWNKDRVGCFDEKTISKIRDYRLTQTFLNQDTLIEKIMKEQLEINNIEFEHPYRFGYFICDFAIPDKKIIIECDGDYWHTLPRNISYDKRKDYYCKKLGWKVIRFTETKIHNEIQSCINEIKDSLQ